MTFDCDVYYLGWNDLILDDVEILETTRDRIIDLLIFDVIFCLDSKTDDDDVD